MLSKKMKDFDTTEDVRNRPKQTKQSIFLSKLHGENESLQPKEIKKKVIKNLFVLCFAWMSLFTSWQSIANLQSSINMEEGLGTTSLAVVYVGVVASTCFQLPPLVIQRLGCKWTLVIAMIGYISYFVSNYLPNWPSLISGSVAIGFAGGFLWSAKSTYLSQLSSVYARALGKNSEATLSKFFGIFYAFFFSCQIWGNLISSLTLMKSQPISNSSNNSTEFCGIKFCPQYGYYSDNLERPSDQKIFTLVTIYVLLAVSCFLLFMFFLDDIILKSDSKFNRKTFCSDTMKPILKQSISPNQLLLIPLTVFIGVQQTFIAAEYTMAFVSCNLGIENVGYSMIAYGTFSSAVSISYGFLSSKINRVYLMCFGGIVHLTAILTLFLWTNLPRSLITFICIPAFWGLGEILQTHLNSIYGFVFHRNTSAAFTNMMLWKSIGFIIGFSYSNLLCIHSKCIILLVLLLVSAVCYSIMEWKLRKSNKCEIPGSVECQTLNIKEVQS